MGGGKKQQAQRTKGNLQPSSSARSAELLEAAGDNPFNPAFQNTFGWTTVDADALPEFKIAIKKMSKKDVTTRLKAVKEFTDLCKEKTPEEVLCALPAWPRLYKKLCCECDSRLREAAQKAMGQVALSAGKKLALHLKSIMGPWVCSMCDPHPPIANQAKEAFKASFSPHKQADALMFCKDEIFSFLEDNLFVQTPQTMSDDLSEEERKQKHQMIISSSLGAVGLILTSVSSDQLTKLEANLIRLLQEAKFWKYAKSDSSHISAAWFRLICGFCFKTPHLMQSNASKVCSSVAQRFDESDPLVISVVCETFLSLSVAIEDYWSHLPIKVFMPKLWSLLKKGGQGSAVVVYPSLLPLLSKIPSSSLPDVSSFFASFFRNMEEGLRTDKVQSSSLEMNAILRAYFECLRYVISKPDLVIVHEMCIKQNLAPLLLSPIRDQTSKLSNSLLFHLFGDLYAYMCRQMSPEDENHSFTHLCSVLWTELMPTLTDVVNNFSAKHALDGINSLFSCLRSPDKNVLWNPQEKKVKFTERHLQSRTVVTSRSTIDFKVWPDTNDIPFVSQNARELAVLSIEKANTSPLIIEFLAVLTKNYYSQSFFEKIVEPIAQKESKSPDNVGGLILVFEHIILSSTEASNSNVIPIVEMLLAMLCCCENEDDGLYMLERITKMDDPKLLEATIQGCIEFLPKHPAVNAWLKVDLLGDAILDLSKCMKEESENLVKLVLSPNQNSEPFLGKAFAETLFKNLAEAVREVASQESKRKCLMYVCSISESCFSSVSMWQIAALEDLLVTLVVISLSPPPGMMMEKVQQTWKAGFTHLLKSKGGYQKERGFFQLVAERVKDRILDGTVRKVSQLQVITKVCCDLLDIMKDCLCDDSIFDNESCCQFLEMIFPSESEWEALEDIDNPLVILDMLFRKNLFYPTCEYSTQEWESLGEGKSEWSLPLTALHVFSVLEHLNSGNFVKDGKSFYSRFNFHLDHIAFASEYAKGLNSMYEHEPASDEVEFLRDLHRPLVDRWDHTFENYPAEEVAQLAQRLIQRSHFSGGLWSCASYVTMHYMNYNAKTRASLVEIVHSQVFKLESYESLGQLHNLQLMMHIGSQKQRDDLAKLSMETLLKHPGLPPGPGLDALVTLISRFNCKGEQISEVIHYLMACEDLLTATSLSSRDWPSVCRVVWVMKLLEAAMRFHPLSLRPTQWGWILCTMSSWVQTMFDCEPAGGRTLMELYFIHQTCRLLLATFDLMNYIKDDTTYQKKLFEEWRDIFADHIFKMILNMFVKLAERLKAKPLNPVSRQLLHSISLVAVRCDREQLKHIQLPVQTSANDAKVSTDVATLLNTLSSLVLSPHYAVQLTAYTLLERSVWFLRPEERISAESEDEEILPLPHPLSMLIEETQEVMESELVFGNIREGEHCEVPAHTDVYRYAAAHLFTWRVVMTFLSHLRKEDAHFYISYIKEKSLFNRFLSNVFKMLPENLEEYPYKYEIPEEFTSLQEVVSAHESNWELVRLNLVAYWTALCDFPGLVRQWWNGQPKRSASHVEYFTTRYVASPLCKKEYNDVTSHPDRDGMKFASLPALKQVVATCSIEECSMEVVVKFPDNYPLGAPTVEFSKKIGVSPDQWRKWKLRLTTYLNNQKGSIVDGLLLWKSDVDKQFEGKEECHICFWVLHPSSYKLPKMTCKTCRKKFHRDCLFQWFRTSFKSTCPVCRSVFGQTT